MAQGIEFLLELQAKLDGATKMVQALTGVEKSVHRTDEAIKHMEKEGGGELRQLGDWFKELGKAATGSFTGMLGAEAVWDSIKEGVHVVGELIGELFEAAGQGERTRLAFENMLGVEPGNELLEYLDQVSSKTEFTREPLKGFAQQLLDAGYSGESLKNALAATLDVAARTPNKMEGAGNAISALSRIMLTGTLDARALRMLKLQPKQVFAQMAKDMGLGVKEVQKKLEAGKLKTEDVVNSVFTAVAAKGGGVLGKVGADMADTFSARFERFKAILPALFEDTSKSPGLRSLGDSLQRITDLFAPESPLGKAIVKGLGEGMTAFADALAKVDVKALSDGLTTLFQKLPDMIATTTKVMWGFAKAVGWVYEHTLPVALAKESMKTPEQVAAEKPGLLRRISRGLLFGQPPAAGPAAAAGGDFSMLDNPAPFSMVPGGAASAGAAGKDLGRATGEGIVAGAKEALGTHSPSDEFQWMGQMSARGYQQGLEMAPPSLAAGGFDQSAQGPSGRGGAGQVSVSAPITVHVGGSESSAEDIAEAIRLEVPSAIIAALEELGLAAGAA